MSIEETLIRLVGTPPPLLLVTLCYWRALRLVSSRTTGNYRAVTKDLTIVALVIGATAAVWLVVSAILFTGVFGHAGLFRLSLFVAFLNAIYAVLIGLATIPVLQLISGLRQAEDNEAFWTPRIDLATSIIQSCFWITAVVFSASVIIQVTNGLLLAAILVLGFIPLMLWQRRRACEGQLLWLLALSVKNEHDLAEEIEGHAATWRGIYAARLRQMVVYLRAGRSLGMTLSQAPSILPRWVIASIHIGEETGTLNEVLTECATDQLKWMKERFRAGSLAGLLIYLSTYFWVTAGLVSFLMIFIVPKYKAIFEGFGTSLPDITVALIKVSDVMYPLVFLGTPISIIVVMVFLRIDDAGWRNLRMRLFRNLYPRYDASPILRHLSRMISIGKTLPEGLLAIANSYHRPTVAESIALIYVDVDAGGDCWNGLLHRGFISHRDLALIQSAQRNGNLPWALREIADVRETRYLFRVNTTCQLFRPIPVLSVGLVVGWICIAVFFPLIKLLNDLS